MKWVSNKISKKIVEKFNDILPSDFNALEYISLNPDLIPAGVDDEQKAREHYILFGKKENRIYKKFIPELIVDQNKIKQEFYNNLLYFAPSAPDYDESSGGNRLLQILRILKLDLKYNIYFFCKTYQKIKHLSVLEDLNISFFLPNINKKQDFDQYLREFKKNNIFFNNAIFSWYNIGYQYIDVLKSIYPNIKIIVDSVDVHWIREQRGKNNKLFDTTQESIDFRKNIEKETYKKANIIFAVTEKDKQYIQQEIGYDYNIKILSNIHEKKQINLGNNMIFVGNYNHLPNIDAVESCIEIHKLFQQTEIFKKQKPKLLIAGPFLNEEIKQKILKTEHIDYLGNIENLQDIYEKCCLLISPLSWGGGIKGKICDAGMCGLTILTSDIGNEGINFTNKYNALIANNYKEFVEQLVYFYSLNKTKMKSLGDSGRCHLSNIVSKKAATNTLKESLQDNITIDDISPINNYFDCVCLLCTGKEYVNDTYIKFLNHLSDTVDVEISKNLHFKLVIKTKDTNKYFIPKIIFDKFLTANLIIINIPDEMDIYDNKIDKYSNKDILEKYGSKCGPNFIFFETMKQLSQYNTSLLLECDCILFKNWINRIKKYIESQSFLISGSQADSPNNRDFNHLINQHINGGTAIYASGNILFQKLIKLCEQLWPILLKYHGIDLPYDYIISLTIQNYFNESYNDERIIWSFIKKHYIYNSLIFNWSDTHCDDYNPIEIQKKCNPAILHQKNTLIPTRQIK